MRITLVFFFLILTACSTPPEKNSRANSAKTQVVLPADSALASHERKNQLGYFHFDGQLVATGLLAAYWEAHYPETEPESLENAQPVRELYLRFYPDSNSQAQLPAFASPSGEAVRHQRIFVYRGAGIEPGTLISAYTESEMENINELVENFSEVPDNFLTYREGVTLQPVEVTLDNILSFTEADHRFLYGKIHSLKPLSSAEYFLKQVPDSNAANFLGKPWIEMFYSPGPLLIRATPDVDGLVLLELPNGSSELKKVRTTDEEWMLVEFVSAKKGRTRGFVQKSELFPIN